MNTTKMMRHIAVGALTSGAIAAAGLGLGAGSAAAERPAPTGTWCPGQPLPMGGAAFGWDMNVCHDYWFVSPPEGNVPINMNGIQMDSWVWAGSPPPLVAGCGAASAARSTCTGFVLRNQPGRMPLLWPIWTG